MCKIKQISLAWLLVFFTINSRAQVTVVNNPFNADTIFSQLDVSLIPSGILMDRSLNENSVAAFNGNCNECYTSDESFRQFMLDLQTCRLADNTYLLGYNDVYEDYLQQNRAVPIQIVNVLYDQIRPDAFSEDYLQFNNGILQEGSNTSASPYDSNRFFACRIAKDISLRGISFVIDSTFYLTNDVNFTLDKIEIDFGDGQGFTEVSFGQTVTPNYITFLEELELKVKFTSNGTTLTATHRAKVTDCYSSVPEPVAPPWATASQFQYGNITASRTNNANGLGHVRGNAYVYYRDNPDKGTENLFKKPVIIVEGIDFGPYNQQNAANYLMGNFGWCALWGQDLASYGQLAKMPQLLNEYHDNGYDIIMLDFRDGAADIRENAYLLQTLIDKVNQFKTADAEPNVVLGASMGAIVARYALAQMEQEGKDHCTRLYISFDGPHQGANIPLGAQYFINFYGYNGVNDNQAARDMMASLSTPAAKQLLIKQISSAREAVHNSFFNELAAIGYPQKCKKMAIANGAIDGFDQGYLGGSQIIDYEYTVSNLLGLHIKGNVWSMPGRGSDNLIFEGEMPYANIKWGVPLSWGSTSQQVFVNPTLPHYDNAPGGVRRIARELAMVDTDGYGAIQSLQDNQSFISTISALDISSSNLFLSIKDVINTSAITTPFDDYYGPEGINTLHVEVTDGDPVERGDNITFTFNKTIIGAAVSNPQLASVYNYGDPDNFMISHSEVFGSGRLHLYGNLPDGFTNVTPTSGKTQKYYLGPACMDRELTIRNGGELILGDASMGNVAILEVSPNSIFKVANGGKIKIQEGSSIIIEDGANFIFEDGAQIELLGPNATLEIRGKFTVGNNADFTFSGNGHLIFDQDVKWTTNNFGFSYPMVDEYMQIGDNTTFDVSGPTVANHNHLVVEVRKPLYLRQENGKTFDAVSIKHGQVLLHQNALMFSFSPTVVMYVHFKSVSPTVRHSGFRLWHNTGINTISHSKFSNGNYGALVHWFGGGTPILFNNCDFDNNTKGLKVLGGNFNVNLCDFTNNVWGLEATNLSGSSAITNSKFIGGTPLSQHGAFLEGQSGTSLYVSASEFSNNQSGLYLNANIDARVSCSEFTSNEYGISVMLNSTLDIGDHAKNVFVNDYVDVHMIGDDEQHAIFLNEGFNDFAAKNQSGGLYLYGYNTQVPTFLGGGTQIPADNNKMPAYNFGILNNIMPVDFSFSQNNPNFPHATTAVTLDIPNNLSSIPYNCNGDVYEMGYSAHYRLVAAMPPGGGRISTNSYPFTSLREAALYAIEMVTIDEEERDDITALARFIEILNSPVSQPDAFTNRIQAVVYQQMHQALSNAYQNGSLQNVQDDASNGIHDTVAAVISIIDQLILDLDPTDTLQQPRYFKLHLDKVHAYRVSGHYTAAINVLASSANWTFNYAQTQRVGYWSCVCDAEAAYFNEELAPEEFGYSIEICNQTFAGYNYKRSTIEMGQGYALDTESKLHIGLHPQPAMTNLSMHLSEPFEGMMSYEILDVTGKKVQSGKSQIQGTMENVDVSKLSQGVYMIHIELGNTHQQTLKFVKG